MAVTDDGSRAIAREIEEQLRVDIAGEDLVRQFRIEETAELIATHGFRRVAVQVPDELLHVAWDIVNKLQERVQSEEVKVFVLGDTSYGSCCVDEVAAQHFMADFIVHYGRSCLSDSTRVPVHFVFGELPFEVEEAAQAIAKTLTEENRNQLIVFRDARYDYAIERFTKRVQELIPGLVVKAPLLKPNFHHPNKTKQKTGSTMLIGHVVANDDEKPTVLYIGSEPTQVTQLVLHYDACSIYCIDPTSSSGTVDDALRKYRGTLNKRFLKIQQAKDASVFGILVGTMGVKGYGDVMEHLVKMIKDSGKKSYTFVMGKINPQKLANFPNIDAYIIVACPQNSLVDSKEFFTPVVTPVEVEIALGYREWSTRYSTVFEELLLSKEEQTMKKQIDEDDDTPHFSLATGKLVSSRIYDKDSDKSIEDFDGSNSSEALTATDKPKHITIRYSSPAAEHLATQTFRGLEPNKGDKAPAKAVKGQTGIASELYSIDNNNQDKDNAV